jgi:pectate lyase
VGPGRPDGANTPSCSTTRTPKPDQPEFSCPRPCGRRWLRQLHFGSVAIAVAGILIWLAGRHAIAAPNFDLVGFAAVNGFGHNTTTGGADGAHVQVSTLPELVRYLQTNSTLRVEIMNDIDLSPLANASGGFPPDYPTGEIVVNSNKTIYSENSAVIRRGTLRIGKGSIGKHNIIIRNLKFRDLWVFDPTGDYDQYGWDYIGIEAGSHHVWVDHCDFEQAYDGMIDIKGGADFITVSWNVFRRQKKGNLVGASDNAAGSDRGHLNVTFHHNWYDRVDERMPRMRFGNAHVFNLYCERLSGRGIQSTTEAATLVENVYFLLPRSGSRPTAEENGGPLGIVKVVDSVIVNPPGANVQFLQNGHSNFVFNAPFRSPAPPYPYALDPVSEVPNIVTNYAGIGKIGFELWQMEQFTLSQLTNGAISGPDAAPAGDGVSNLLKYALGLSPTLPATGMLTPLRIHHGDAVLTYQRPTTATDVNYQVEVSTGLRAWTTLGVTHQPVGMSESGLEIWEARHSDPSPNSRFFRLTVSR